MKQALAANLLLVDDDPLVRQSTARLLEEFGLRVIPCAGGQEALDHLQKGPVDVVLSDITMPGLSGIELLDAIKARDPQLPVLLMTGYADLELALTAIHRGVFDFILKPYNPQQLFHSVKKALDFHRLQLLERSYQAELEEQVAATTAQLQATHDRMLQGEKLAALGQLAAGVAHEINNPVGFVDSNLGTLARYLESLLAYLKLQEEAIASACQEPLRQELAQHRRRLKLDQICDDVQPLLAESREGTGRIKAIVQSLKTFARVDDGELQLSDINAGLESTINICWNEIKYVATLKREYGELPPARVFPQQLNQVFMNLLVNAAQAIEGQGVITVRTWHRDQAIFVAIADTGRGIPPELQQKIFEPFFTTKEAGKGTGLGLSILADILRKHQGEIWLESVPGAGTTFTLKLPLLPEH
ncbi:MAG: response regulator [Trichloromonadaceae bacterium]